MSTSKIVESSILSKSGQNWQETITDHEIKFNGIIMKEVVESFAVGGKNKILKTKITRSINNAAIAVTKVEYLDRDEEEHYLDTELTYEDKVEFMRFWRHHWTPTLMPDENIDEELEKVFQEEPKQQLTNADQSAVEYSGNEA